MKTLKLFFASIITLLFSSCADNNKLSYTYELDPKTHDTINVTNENGRQGHWVIENTCADNLPRPKKNHPDSVIATKPQTIELTNASMPNVIEIGNYVDNKRQGLWTYYDPYGDVNKTVEFKDDLPLEN